MKYTVEVNEYGDIFWYKEGTDIFHREDGPAKEYADGTKKWYKEGKLHREDRPAVEYNDGTKEYWVDGKQLTKEEFNNRKTSFTKEQLKNITIK